MSKKQMDGYSISKIEDAALKRKLTREVVESSGAHTKKFMESLALKSIEKVNFSSHFIPSPINNMYLQPSNQEFGSIDL